MKIEEIILPKSGELVARSIVDASFGEWLNYIFDRPERDQGSHWSLSDVELCWDVPNLVTAEYLARTYEDPDAWVGRFSPGQIAAGLEFTWSPGLGHVCFTIRDEPVPWMLRQRAIQALVPLYERCFQKLCEPGLSHLNECLDNPLNGVCYMFWDVCPFYGQPEKKENREIDAECLRVMEQTLQIDHDACRESTLHGLGHWAIYYPSKAASIIEQGLKNVKRKLRPELVQYASAAARGCVQ